MPSTRLTIRLPDKKLYAGTYHDEVNEEIRRELLKAGIPRSEWPAFLRSADQHETTIYESGFPERVLFLDGSWKTTVWQQM